MYTLPNGETHGLINTLANSVPNKDFANFKEKDRESMKKAKAADAKMVKVRYINSRGGVEQLCKPYMRWQGDNIAMYRLIHNHIYEIPQGLVNEINGNPGLVKRSELLDVNGLPSIKDGSGEKIHSVYPAEF